MIKPFGIKRAMAIDIFIDIADIVKKREIVDQVNRRSRANVTGQVFERCRTGRGCMAQGEKWGLERILGQEVIALYI